MNETFANQSPEAVHQGDGSSNASASIKSDHTLPIISLMVSIAAMIWCYTLSREAKQVQIQLMYANALFIREGLVKDGDVVYGPEGNLEYKSFKLQKPKEK